MYVEFGQGEVDFDENFLSDVFDVVSISYVMVGQVDYRLMVFLNQFIECGRIAFLAANYQLAVFFLRRFIIHTPDPFRIPARQISGLFSLFNGFEVKKGN